MKRCPWLADTLLLLTMSKKKMPPELLEHFKKKNKGKDEPEEKGDKAEKSAKKGLEAARAAKKFKDQKKKDS